MRAATLTTGHTKNSFSQSARCTCVEILNERLQEEKHEVPTLKLRHCTNVCYVDTSKAANLVITTYYPA